MGTKTKIEWCDSTINPIMGCTGCELRKDHCYAATLCARYAGRKGWPKSFDEPEFFPGRIQKALRWSDLTGKTRPNKPWLNGYPRIIFVNDLSDGFCPDVDPDTWLPPQSLGPMAASPHIWLLLTKWPNRMRIFFEQYQVPDNFWLGTSVSQQRDEWRIENLLQIQGAAVRFVSCEPLLDHIKLRNVRYRGLGIDALTGKTGTRQGWPGKKVEQLSWVIVGGESGPGARPMNPDWARSLRDQCQAAGTPYFFKSWGDYLGVDYSGGMVGDRPTWTRADGPLGNVGKRPGVNFGDGHGAVLLGKHRTGRMLDGREHNDLPNTPKGES